VSHPRRTPSRDAPGVPSAPALEEVLRRLGPQVRRGAAPALPAARLPSGLAPLDALLGGGVPRGALCEIRGAVSSGRTSLGLRLLATAIREGGLAALVDAADCLDPPSAAASGVVLSRLLWVRAPDVRTALRSTERLLETRGLPLVLLDLALPPTTRLDIAPAAWPRLARAAAAGSTALVVLGTAPLAGPQASLTFELEPAQPCFTGRPALFEGLTGRLRMLRGRGAAERAGATLSLRLRAAG